MNEVWKPTETIFSDNMHQMMFYIRKGGAFEISVVVCLFPIVRILV